jgi:uncharacterized protein YqjF (DUF2071 family)
VPIAPRPPIRWFHSLTDLDDFALINWAVDPAKVQALLPPGFTVDERDGHALVSMVAFLDHEFHFRGAPFVRLTCGQVNYRGYVRRGDDIGVWFFGTTLDSRLVTVPRRLWQMPWQPGRMDIDAHWGQGGCESWRTTVDSVWGAADVTLRGTGADAPRPAEFPDDETLSAVLRNPFIGWYDRANGSGVGRYTVWHEPLALEEALVTEAYCQVYTDLGLIEDGQLPIHAGVQRRTVFDVHTPPTRVR